MACLVTVTSKSKVFDVEITHHTHAANADNASAGATLPRDSTANDEDTTTGDTTSEWTALANANEG